ncbi:MAG: hypothetical protein IH626_05390 [Rhodospirillales bacterium]|nr:hypothetical protein [Rhodospirillales bacterium]
MPTRAEHIEDIRLRLTGRIDAVGERVWRGRVETIPPRSMPAICLYAPEEDSGEALVRGGHAQYRPTHTLAIEVRVPDANGFDVAAGDIVEEIKTILFRDPAWTVRFQPHPRWRVRQFVDRRGEQAFCGEVLTLVVADKQPVAYPPLAPQLTRITASADVDGDGVADLTSQTNIEEE